MNKDQYLRMVEQTGEEIDWDRIPPDIEDFPDIVHTSVDIYNLLGDRIYPDVGFVGKDYTNLDYLFTSNNIEGHQHKELIFDLLHFLEKESVEESRRQIKASYDKIKRK